MTTDGYQDQGPAPRKGWIHTGHWAEWHDNRKYEDRVKDRDRGAESKVWLALTSPEDRIRGKISLAEKHWHIQQLIRHLMRWGAVDSTAWARRYDLPTKVAAECIDTATQTIKYVAATGDGAAVRETISREILDLYEEAREAKAYEASCKMLDLLAKVNGAHAPTQAKIQSTNVQVDLVGQLTTEQKEYFLKYNQLPAEAFATLGFPVPDSAPSLLNPPNRQAEIIETYLEPVENDEE